jgi:predicted dehydrogenase
MEQVRIGFIGAGGIARRHMDVLRGFADVRLTAFSDPALDRAEAIAREVDAAAYADWAAMLDRESLDAVYLCVPPFAHGPAEMAVIARGLPFFVEKPIALDLETAETIADAADAAGLATAVGYHWRYMDTTDEARTLLADNPARLVLGYWLDSTPPPAWWRHEGESGGQMHEQTTHLFDLARYLVGEVETVFAVGSTKPRAQFPDLDILDTTTATLRFENGAVGTMASTCLLNWNHRIGLHLFGEGLAIELSMFDIMIDVGRGRPVRGAHVDPVVLEDRDFIDAVKGGANRIRTPYREALHTHRLTLAAAQSARSGQPVRPTQTTQAEARV